MSAQPVTPARQIVQAEPLPSRKRPVVIDDADQPQPPRDELLQLLTDVATAALKLVSAYSREVAARHRAEDAADGLEAALASQHETMLRVRNIRCAAQCECVQPTTLLALSGCTHFICVEAMGKMLVASRTPDDVEPARMPLRIRCPMCNTLGTPMVDKSLLPLTRGNSLPAWVEPASVANDRDVTRVFDAVAAIMLHNSVPDVAKTQLHEPSARAGGPRPPRERAGPESIAPPSAPNSE